MRLSVRFLDHGAADDFHAMAGNMRDLAPAFEDAFRLQERIQREPFTHGELVDSGTLLRSLTATQARGAIRQVWPSSAEFGTSISYARPAAHRAGRRIVLPFGPGLGNLVLQHIVEPMQ